MPINSIQKRPPELGRIRLGEKTASGSPRKLETFRLTSFNKALLDEAARLYGGTVKRCTDPALKNQYEVVLASSSLPVYVAPIPVSQFMENWEGGSCQRRCDSDTELRSGLPCLCKSEENMVCKPYTRVAFLLYELPGAAGFWRLESHGWNAAVELAATCDLLLGYYGLKGAPLACALRLEMRSGKFVEGGKTKTSRFMVPVIDVPYTPQDLLLMVQEQKALEGAAEQPATVPSLAQDVEAPVRDAQDAEAAEAGGEQDPKARLRRMAFGLMANLGYPKHEGVGKAVNYRVWGLLTGRKVKSASDYGEEEWATICDKLKAIEEDREPEPHEWARWREGSHPSQTLAVALPEGAANA